MPKTINSDRWISPQEVCKYLGVKRHTILRWVRQRRMPASKVGKLWSFKTATSTNGSGVADLPMSGR